MAPFFLPLSTFPQEGGSEPIKSTKVFGRIRALEGGRDAKQKNAFEGM